MIDRKNLKEFYSNLIQHVIQQHLRDETDSLFLKFIDGLSDAFTDEITKHPQYQKLNIHNIELLDVALAFESYMYAFCRNQPVFHEDNYGVKAARFYRAFVFEILEDVNMPVAKRLAVADNQIKSMRGYEFIHLMDKTPDFNKIASYIEDKRSSLLLHLHTSASATIPEPVNPKGYDLFYWAYELEMLNALEEKLKGVERVEINSTLIPLFSSGIIPDNLVVNWKGRQGALIYLIYMLADKQRDLKGLNIYEFTSKRFLVGNRRVTAKQLSSTFGNLTTRHFQLGLIPNYIEEINGLIKSIGINV